MEMAESFVKCLAPKGKSKRMVCRGSFGSYALGRPSQRGTEPLILFTENRGRNADFSTFRVSKGLKTNLPINL